MIEQEPSLGDASITGLPYVGAEFVFSAREEMSTSLVDLLTRRARAHLQDARATLAAAADIAKLVAPDMRWDERETRDQVARYRDLVEAEFAAAGLAL